MRAAAVALALLLVLCSAPPATYEMASGENKPAICVDEGERDTLRTMMSKALDTAFQHYVERAFEGWMKDDHDQPERAARGVREAINAYVHAHRAAATWAPMVCR